MDKKVLIVRLSAMGDVIFTIPLANILKDNGYKVYWLVSEKGYSLVKGNSCVDEAILAPIEKWKKNKNKLANLWEYFSIIKKIRDEKFDIALDTQLILKSLLWMVFCGAKRKIVAKNYREMAVWGGNEVISATRVGYEPHAVKSYLKYAEHLGLDTTNIKVTLPEISGSAKTSVDELLLPIDKEKPIIVCAPATTWVTKHWNKDNWKKLIEKISDDYNVVLSGGKNDEELLNYVGNEKTINLAGRTNLEELQELLSRADIVISLDSGTTHLAWATQKPKIISLFCSTPQSLYAPINTTEKIKYISLSAENICVPCHRRKCPKGTNECTKYPAVEDVLNAVEKLK
ncbi:MAG: glycosyltransferase family 9 protein [bacterium]|nr:glycosyltransferase family 9 protein [bacterium]